MLRMRCSALSLLLHALLMLLLCWFSLRAPVATRAPRREPVQLVFTPPLERRQVRGGGAQATLPASRGALPAPARTFVPPQALELNARPRLVMPVAMDAPPEIAASAAAIGDPNSLLAGLSGGTGGPRGIGSGSGPSIGPGAGREGETDGLAPGHGVSMPVPIHRVDPEYSEPARKARISGTVLVACVVDVNGRPRDLQVARGVGLGLDEKALEAVGQWLFKPGTKGGKAVAVRALIEVSFRIL